MKCALRADFLGNGQIFLGNLLRNFLGKFLRKIAFVHVPLSSIPIPGNSHTPWYAIHAAS